MKKFEDYFINMAEIFLNEQGEFYPFSGGLNNSDEIQMITPYSDNDNPKSDLLIQQFREYGQKSLVNRKIKRIGICYDVNIKFEDKTKSAIQIEFLSMVNDKIKSEKRTYLYEKCRGKFKISTYNNI